MALGQRAQDGPHVGGGRPLGVVPLPDGVSPDSGTVNRRVAAVVTELDGRKSLYSTAFYERDEFWSIYGGHEYPALKERYDPDGRLLGLYEKVVGRK